jgi:hypothetical protein
MIFYVSTQRFSAPARRLRRRLPPELKRRFRHLSYEELLFERAGPIGHYIFTDFDRLTRSEIESVAAFATALRKVAPQAKILNDPVRVLERTPLLCALHARGINDFAVTRLDSGARPDRYPVFVRAEDGYAGPETGLLHSRDELEAALADLARRGLPLKGRIAVGYAAEPGADGLYRRYCTFNVDGEVFAHQLHRSRHWIVKRNHPIFDGSISASNDLQNTPEAQAELFAFLRENPHTERLAEVFRIAGIDFGRADYGVVGGRVQVYEINTNPNAPRSRRASVNPERVDLIDRHMLPALEHIDVPIDVEGRVAFRETRPRAHDVRLPRLRLPISIARRIGDRIRRPKRAD